MSAGSVAAIPAIARADAALADPAFSQGVFFIAPGTHAIEFEQGALVRDQQRNGRVPRAEPVARASD